MKQFLYIVVLHLVCSTTFAQYTSADYQKADSTMNHYASLIYNQVKKVSAIPESSNFWYKVKTKDGLQYYLVNSEKQTKKAIFEPSDLSEALSKATEDTLVWKKIYLAGEKVSKDGHLFQFNYKGFHWEYSPKKKKLVKKDKIAPSKPRGHWAIARNELGKSAITSPDSSHTAYIQEYNLYVKELASGKAQQLTYDGSPGQYYSSYIAWSPDSKHLATNKFRSSEKRFIKFMEAAPNGQLQPKLHEVEYWKPGDALPIKEPCVFSVSENDNPTVNFGDYLNQYTLSDPKWRNDSKSFTVEYNQRGHQRYTILEVEATTGQVSILVDEQPETFFTYSSKKYRKDINDGKEIIWMSERDGWNHLYLYDDNGQVKHQITKGEWVVRKVIKVDEIKRQILFAASGMNEGEDPYYMHYYTIDFDGKNLTSLSPEKANHDVQFSKHFNYFVDTYSRADLPPTTVLRKSSNGEIILTLEQTDISDLQKTPWQQPEVFSAKGRDGKTDIWGLIYRPSNYDPTKKYPIIEYIYAGPHDSFVPKSFLGVSRRYSALAELGFICVQIDGMGTSNRSKAFHDVCWKNLKDAGFPDRIAWIKAAAQKYPYMDTERVGIYGGSAGGQSSTGAVLFHPEFYDVAVSSCGCHDNRMDKIWWNEQWMGYPIGKHYDESSNVVNAHKLQGHLMLILGEVDDNVDPASTVQVVDALIKADKDFEFVLLPSTKHTLGGNYGETKRRDFFIKHLKGESTPDWNKE